MTEETTRELLLQLHTILVMSRADAIRTLSAQMQVTHMHASHDILDFRQSRSYLPGDVDRTFCFEYTKNSEFVFTDRIGTAKQRKYDVIYEERLIQTMTYTPFCREDFNIFLDECYRALLDYTLDVYHLCRNTGKMLTYSSFCNLQRTVEFFNINS